MEKQQLDIYNGFNFEEEPEEKAVEQSTAGAFNAYDGFNFDEDASVLETEEQITEDAKGIYDGFNFETVEQPTESGVDPDEYNLDVEKTFDEFAADQGYIDSIEEYAISRYGQESGARGEDETNEEYLERFLTHIRQFENNSIELASQLDWIRGASEEEKQNFGYVYSQLEKMPSFFEDGGGSFGRGLRDYALSIASDPLMLIGFGAGKVAGTAAQRGILQVFKQQGKEAAMAAAKNIATRKGAMPIAVGTAAEVAGETAANLGLQQIEAEAGIITEEDISFLEAGFVGGLTGILGVGGGVLSQRDIVKKTKKLIEDDEAFQRTLNEAAEAAGEATEEVTQDLAEEGYQFNPVQGYEVLRPLSEVMEESGLPASEITSAQMAKEVSTRVTKAATEIATDLVEEGDPKILSMINDGAKASDIVREIIVREDIDSDLISGAIARAGLTPEEFANVSGATLTDAATITGAYGQMGKFIKRMRELDPELAQTYKDLFRADDSSTFLGKAHDYMMKLDRERRALMVTQIATTARNVATGVMRLGFDGAANLIESSLYHLGRTGNALGDGAVQTTGRRSGFQNIMRDSFGMLGRLVDQGGSKAATDALLKYNPRLARTLDRSLQEAGPDDLSKFSLFFNKLNMAQDVMFRRAVFADAVDKRLRRISGETMDLEKFVASGRALPNDILQDSVEEALAFTFARMPKPGGKKIGDTVGYHFIKVNEAIGPVPAPLGTATFPFSRFMVNAMQFQFDYSPLGAVNAVFHAAKGKHMKAIKGMSDAKTEAEMMKAREAFSKSVVGTAALSAAVYYRANNQDTRWYDIKSDDGRTLDARPFFPIAPYLAVADFIVKAGNGELDEIGVKEILEGITGAQMRTGASSFVVDTFFEELSAEAGGAGLTGIGAQRAGEIVGGYLGELTGAVFTPFRFVEDTVAQFDKDLAIVRDSSQAEGMNFYERATSAFVNKNLKKIPLGSYALPELESPTREGPVIRQSPLVGQLTGIRMEQKRTDIEQELISLGFENYNLVPSTGDKIADSFVKKHMGKLVDTQLAREIDNDTFRNKSTPQKKAAIKNKLRRYRKLAKLMGKAEAGKPNEVGYKPFDRAEWSKLPKVARSLADEYYMERYGKSVMEMQSDDPDTNHLKVGTIVGRALSRAMQ